MTMAAKKIKITAAVFELPQKLGVLQYVEYEPPPKERAPPRGAYKRGF